MKKLDIFYNRLVKIGITVTLTGNMPWVYVASINGVAVKQTYMSDHGFVLGYQTNNGFIFEKDLSPLFTLLRKFSHLNTF